MVENRVKEYGDRRVLGYGERRVLENARALTHRRLVDGALHHALGMVVECGGRLVQEQDGGVPHLRSRRGEVVTVTMYRNQLQLTKCVRDLCWKIATTEAVQKFVDE